MLKTQDRLFAGTARNLGAKNIKSSWIGFIDADCIISDTWLNEIAERISSLNKDTAFTGPILPETNISHNLLALHVLEFHEFLGTRDFRARFAPTGNFVISKNIFEITGGFEDWEQCEDIGFMQRLKVKAKVNKIVYLPQLTVTHQTLVLDQQDIHKKVYQMGYFRGWFDTALTDELQVSTQGLKKIVLWNPGFFLFSVIIMRLFKHKSFMRYFSVPLFIRLVSLTRFWGQGLKQGILNQKLKTKEL